MISDESIARTALAISIVGLLLLFFSLQAPSPKSIAEALKAEKNAVTSITAKVNWARESGNSVIFELDDGNKITAVFSNASAEQKALIQRNNALIATGSVSGKSGKKQFNVKEVKRID